jgi:predicted peroxiredoxin
MAGEDNSKVVINLATGLEDPEKVMIAFLVGGAAAEKGRPVTMFLTKEAIRLAVPGVAVGVACDGCPPIERLFQQYADNGGELLVCPICVKARQIEEGNLVPNARIGGATPLWDWVGEEPATVFSY